MKKRFEQVVSNAKKLGLFIVNSEEENFTDRLDESLRKDAKHKK